jgi:hypothetical protein
VWGGGGYMRKSGPTDESGERTNAVIPEMPDDTLGRSKVQTMCFCFVDANRSIFSKVSVLPRRSEQSGPLAGSTAQKAAGAWNCLSLPKKGTTGRWEFLKPHSLNAPQGAGGDDIITFNIV